MSKQLLTQPSQATRLCYRLVLIMGLTLRSICLMASPSGGRVKTPPFCEKHIITVITTLFLQSIMTILNLLTRLSSMISPFMEIMRNVGISAYLLKVTTLKTSRYTIWDFIILAMLQFIWVDGFGE